jgi:hypothetical protein
MQPKLLYFCYTQIYFLTTVNNVFPVPLLYQLLTFQVNTQVLQMSPETFLVILQVRSHSESTVTEYLGIKTNSFQLSAIAYLIESYLHIICRLAHSQTEDPPCRDDKEPTNTLSS